MWQSDRAFGSVRGVVYRARSLIKTAQTQDSNGAFRCGAVRETPCVLGLVITSGP